MKKIIFTSLAMMASLSLSAQYYTGQLINKDIMELSDMANISQTQFQFGTARSMAMGGAFTSLGADASSMAINPAGLGMYRRSEFTVTPMVSVQTSENNFPTYGDSGGTNFSFSNFSYIYNAISRESGSLLSLSLGIGYTRIADFNYCYSTKNIGNDYSVGDLYAEQLNDFDISRNTLSGSGAWDTSSQLWGAVLGYRAGMVNTDRSGTWQSNYNLYSTATSTVNTDQYMSVESSGAIGEYAFSMGANYANKLYFGFTVGIQDLYQRIYYDYAEEYSGGDGDSEMPSYAYLNQAVSLSGTGINLKVGVVYRPTAALRLGFAIHTPTGYSINRSYDGYSATDSYQGLGGVGSSSSPILEDYGRWDWQLRTPTRMLFGASYSFGVRGLISVDYERDWYNGIRVRDTPYDDGDYYDDMAKELFKGCNTIRIGGEFKATPLLALRAGYGMSDGFFKDEEQATLTFGSPVTSAIEYYSGGIGFFFSEAISLDLSYMYYHTDMTDYQLFYSEDFAGNITSSSDWYSTSLTNHNIAATLVFHF